jgi:hypothetical protein
MQDIEKNGFFEILPSWKKSILVKQIRAALWPVNKGLKKVHLFPASNGFLCKKWFHGFYRFLV